MERVKTSAPVTAVLNWDDYDDACVHAYLPNEWWPKSDGHRGPGVADPGVIYFCMPLGVNEDVPCVWKTTMGELIGQVIEGHEYGEGGHLGKQGTGIATRFRDELLRLAGLLTERIDLLPEGFEGA